MQTAYLADGTRNLNEIFDGLKKFILAALLGFSYEFSPFSNAISDDVTSKSGHPHEQDLNVVKYKGFLCTTEINRTT